MTKLVFMLISILSLVSLGLLFTAYFSLDNCYKEQHYSYLVTPCKEKEVTIVWVQLGIHLLVLLECLVKLLSRYLEDKYMYPILWTYFELVHSVVIL